MHFLWRLIGLKTCINKNQACDTSAQNSISEWKTILVREQFYSACTNAVPQARGCDECTCHGPVLVGPLFNSLWRRGWNWQWLMSPRLWLPLFKSRCYNGRGLSGRWQSAIGDGRYPSLNETILVQYFYIVSFTVIEGRGCGEQKVWSGNCWAGCVLVKRCLTFFSASTRLHSQQSLLALWICRRKHERPTADPPQFLRTPCGISVAVAAPTCSCWR